MRLTLIYICIALLLFVLTACREENEIFIADKISLDLPAYTSIHGFYLLNEGNMGSNKATLDYYDYTTGTYTRNIYGQSNPSVPKEMGDVGNDIAIYGSRLWVVINCSNKIEVMDATSARRIGQVDIANCRYIRFHEGYAYVTSYAGPVVIKPDYEQRGFVAKIDTATLQIVDTCLVGFQPDELEIADSKIYVANSGGYMVPNYENTVSVIDLNTFREMRRIPVAINLHHLRIDRHGQLWVSSRGDYYDEPSRLYSINIAREQACADYGITDRNLWLDSVDVAVSNFHIDGDSLYLYSSEWSYQLMDWTVTYGIVNTLDHQLLTRNFITDGTDKKISMPYGIKVNPITKDIYVTDAKNYVNPGTLWCFGPDGVAKWSVRTGDIPAHIVFLGEQ